MRKNNNEKKSLRLVSSSCVQYFNIVLKYITLGGGGWESETGSTEDIEHISGFGTLCICCCSASTRNINVSELNTFGTESASSISGVSGLKTLTVCSRGYKLLDLPVDCPQYVGCPCCHAPFSLTVLKNLDIPSTPLLAVPSRT